MSLTYRSYRPDDLPAIEKLWKDSTGWGALTPDIFSWHMDNSPFGRPIITVAEESETGTIVGQTVLIPSLVSVQGKRVTAFRPVAPIMARSLRRTFIPTKHPIFQLYRFGFQELRERGEQLILMIPDPKWMVLFRMLPDFLHHSFPLWSLPLPLADKFHLEPGYSCGPLTNWEAVDRLFEHTSKQTRCMVVRDGDALQKKAGPRDHEVLGIERAGELVGVVCSRQKGDRQWLICDLMAVDTEATVATLKAVCNLAHQRATSASSTAPIHKAAILAVSSFQPLLAELGFRRDEYDFHLVVKILDENLPESDVHPSGWYISAND